MLIEINPDNIDQRLIEQAVSYMKNGGVIIFPTDSVYAMGCDLYNKKGLNSLATLKGVKLKKANFSIICSDLSELSNYVRHIERPTYKILNKSLPGPFTFILNATNEVSRIFDTNKKEVGIRIPNNKIVSELTRGLGNPMATTSLHDEEDRILEYFTDPYEIYQRYDEHVDFIIDGGKGNLDASTVVDCTTDSPEIIRQGIGNIDI